jgi:SAM-dependent methyltransferase
MSKARAPCVRLREEAMDQMVNPHSAFLHTSTKAALGRWDDLLRLQVDLFFPQESAYLQTFEPWRAARHVLDVGCGNGYYLSRLQSEFPQKLYFGIDLSRELIAEARTRHSGPDLRFAQANLFDFSPPRRFDLVVMRFLVQHLTDLAAVIERAERLATVDGGLLVVEPDLGASRNTPATPRFEELLERFEAVRKADGRMKGRLDEFGAIAARAGWRLERDHHLMVTTPRPIENAQLLPVYFRWIELCENSGLLAYPFAEARRELTDWAADNSAVSAICLRFLYLRSSAAADRIAAASRAAW